MNIFNTDLKGSSSTYFLSKLIMLLISLFVLLVFFIREVVIHKKYFVTLNDQGIFINDLEGKNQFISYENIKQISLPNKRSDAIIETLDYDYFTLWNSIECFPLLIDELKAKGIPFTKEFNYAGFLKGTKYNFKFLRTFIACCFAVMILALLMIGIALLYF
jgi:hypothetical protein